MIKLTIDNQEIEAEEGKPLLQVALDNDIYIPNLCYLEAREHPHASCRLCFVEIEGEKHPVPSCTLPVKEGMKVSTDTPGVRALQKAAFELLLSVHHVNCKECHANKACELQRIAKFLKAGLKSKRFDLILKPETVNEDHPFLRYYPNHCVLCGKCVYVCQQTHGRAYLTFARRGMDTIISFFGEKELTALPCKENPACVEICPVGALALKQGEAS